MGCLEDFKLKGLLLLFKVEKIILIQNKIKNAYSLFAYKFSTYRFFLKRAFPIFTENNFYNELDNIRIISQNNDFKIQHVCKLIVDITNIKKPEQNTISKNTNFMLFSIFQNFFRN